MNWYGLHISKPKHIIQSTSLTAMSFFLGNPRGYNYKPWEEKQIEIIKEGIVTCPNLSPSQIPIHGCYLINLTSPDEETLMKSRVRIRQELETCTLLGLERYVLHPGYTKGNPYALQQLSDELNSVLDEFPQISILVEHMTGRGKLCETLEEIRWLIDHDTTSHLHACLDTAHWWGCGYDPFTMLDEFESKVGLEHLKALHLNDSKAKAGSHRDLHEDIGKGNLPKDFWSVIVKDKRLHNVPVILETPTNCHNVVSELINNVSK